MKVHCNLLILVHLWLMMSLVPVQSTNQFPYQAGLIIDAAKFCSGALISENFVVTTANCVYKAFEVDVILDTDNLLNKSSVAFICTSIIIHEDFDGSLNDIALIKLPAKMDSARSQTVTILQLPQSQPGDGAPLLMTGFNLNSSTDGKIGHLGSQIVNVNDDRCKNYDICLSNPDKVFCATSDDVVDNADNELWNVGSPLVSNNGRVLVGMTVQVEQSATIATSIFPFVDWLSFKLIQ